MEFLITIMAAAAFLYFAYIVFVKHKPRWQQVFDDIEELIDLRGESLEYTQNYLQDTYQLTQAQAKLCVNNYPDQSWFQMQTFLEDADLS